jgi:hypothetical protein
MSPLTRLILGTILVQVVQFLFAGTVVYLIRRWNKTEPVWSWARCLGAFFLLGLATLAAGIIPLAGAFVVEAVDRSAAALVAVLAPLFMVIVYLVGLKRMTGLEVLGTLVLALGIGIVCFVITIGLSKLMDVDLLSLQMGHER